MARNKLFKAKSGFRTTITVAGDSVWQVWAAGDERDLTAEVAALLQREVPGVLVEVKPKAEKVQPKVETSAGATDKAETRQVTDAPKRRTRKATK